MSDLKIWKAICEIKYPAAAQLFDQRGSIAAKWHGQFDFTDWRIANNEVTLYNKSKSLLFQAGYRRMVCVMELPERYTSFRDCAFKVLFDTLDTLSVSKLERIGLRLLQLDERKSFKMLLAQMRKTLYGIADEAWNPLGGYPIDMGFLVTLQIGDYKANFSMGPMQKEQLKGFFDSVTVQEKLPASALFVDFDLYAEEPKFYRKDLEKKLAQFLELGESEIQRRTAEFVEQFGEFKQ